MRKLASAEGWLAENVPKVKKMVDAGRFRHIERVLAMALRLAGIHSFSQLHAAQAALLHDCAKQIPLKEMRRYLELAAADPWEKQLPPLWHGAVGAYLAKKDFGIKRKEVLRAIRCHSTGLPNASGIQKCLVLADSLELGRKGKGLAALRLLAVSDLDGAYTKVLQKKIEWLTMHQQKIHPRTDSAWNWILNNK
jgi:predicted HD superfamily hydrolase involved in NAD metabolism